MAQSPFFRLAALPAYRFKPCFSPARGFEKTAVSLAAMATDRLAGQRISCQLADRS
jgi:hypothetical protein